MVPAEKFIEELLLLANSNSEFGINPDDKEEYIIDNSVAIEMHPLYDHPNYIHFISIRSLKPGKGKASSAMKKVLNIADKNKVILIGKIIPYHNKLMTKDSLKKWYRKMGCIPYNPNNEDGIWVRAPGGGKANIDISLFSKIKVLNGLNESDYLGKKALLFLAVILGFILLFRNRE